MSLSPAIDLTGVTVSKWPRAGVAPPARKRPHGIIHVAAGCRLNLGLLGDFQCVIDFDAEIAHCTFQFAVAEQQLNGPEILRSLLD